MTRTSRTTRSVAFAVGMALASTALAACGSAGTGSSGAAPTGAAGGGQASASVPTDLPTTPPTALPVTTPVSKPIPSGLHVVYISSGVPQAIAYLNGLKAAAQVLGWEVSSMNFDATNPATINSTVASAVEQKPDAIVIDSLETKQFAAQLPAAAAAHIPIFPIVSTNQPQDGVYPMLRTDVKQANNARVLTDALVSDAAAAKKPAHVLELTVPAFASVLGPADDAVKHELAATCSSCTQELLEINLPDVLSGNYTHQVVSYLQAHPQINYVISDAGQLGDGLGAALQQAGITQVKRYGLGPTNVQIKELRSGAAGGWVTQAEQEGSWEVADEIARVAVGDPTNLWDDENLGLLITSANADTVNADDPEFPTDYPAQFKKLWGK